MDFAKEMERVKAEFEALDVKEKELREKHAQADRELAAIQARKLELRGEYSIIDKAQKNAEKSE
ncbi:MAG: hypothetical protein WC505_07220 [Patescibacteria group bacterium]